MNIYALPGHKVRVTEETAKNGHNHEKEKVARFLTIGIEYTVEKTEVHNWSTDVYLEEFPDESFNSVCFEDVTEQPEELDRQHPYYENYN